MNYEEYERIAIKALKMSRLQITDENIGIVVGAILTADHKYNENIGNKFGYRKMYINFSLGNIRKFNKRAKKLYFVEDYTPFIEKSSINKFKDPSSMFFWENFKSYLTDREYRAIIGKYQYNKTLAHIASELEISPQYVSTILKLARKKIKEKNEVL